MRRLVVLVVVLTSFVLAWCTPVAQAAPDPERSLVVSGAGVGIFPAFDPAVTRYAATTTAATGGSLLITASTTDPAGSVLVDGRPATGPTPVAGLEPGDEVSVIVDDAGGRTSYAIVYLPAGFPALTATSSQLDAAPGLVALTLNAFNQVTPQPAFDVIVDRNGVPAYVAQADGRSLDLKKQPNGEITVSHPTTAPGHTGVSLVTLGDQLTEVARRDVQAPLIDTDGHDSERLPDGSTVLIGYEPNTSTGKVDATIQKQDADGDVTFTWTSAALVGESMSSNADYAHINSVQTVADGDVIASFRHLSAVLRIATVAHDGYEPGDVVWKLGGRDSDFTFVGDPFPGGPCAQHTASELANGHLLVFDNGSNGLCVNPLDPTGPGINRGLTRVTEYALDTTTHTATLVWSYAPAGKYALFAGSARRLDNGNTLIGWAADRAEIATEIDSAGQKVWGLTAAAPTGQGELPYLTYRAALVDALPDRIAPGVTVSTPVQNAQYLVGQAASASFGCTDKGGSNLDTCSASTGDDRRLDTSTPGTHTVTVTGTDGAGNSTTVTRSYVVQPVRRWDAGVRRTGTTSWRGLGIIGPISGQTIRVAARGRTGWASSTVLLRNTGSSPDAVRVAGSASDRYFRVRYLVGGLDVTKRITAGTFRSAELARNGSLVLRVVISRRAGTPTGQARTFVVRGTSVASATTLDRVGIAVVARG